MANARRLASLAVPLIVLSGAIPTACTSTTNPAAPDGGGPPTEDASLPGCVTSTACVTSNDASSGADGSRTQDGGGADDGGSEAGEVTGAVTVTVSGGEGLEANVPVVFHDANGAALSQTVTNALGVATGGVTANGQVTVLLGTAGSSLYVTTQGVQPGDALTVRDPTTPAPDAGTHLVEVTSAPTSTPADSTLIYYYQGKCGAGLDTLVDLDGYLPPNCRNAAGQFPVLGISFGAIGYYYDQEDGYAFIKSTNVATDGGVLDVAMGSLQWVPPKAQNLNMTSVPTERGTLTYTEVATGVPYTREIGSVDLVDGGADGGYGGVVTYTFNSHPGYPDFVQTEAEFETSLGAFQVMAVRADGPSDAGTTFDLTQLLPLLDVATLDSTTNPERPTVRWSVQGAGAVPASAVGVVAGFTATALGVNVQWLLVAPASSTSVQAPALPSGSPFALPASGVTFASQVAVLVGGSALPSYAAMRTSYPVVNNPLAVGATTPPAVPMLAVDGTLVTSVSPAAP